MLALGDSIRPCVTSTVHMRITNYLSNGLMGELPSRTTGLEYTNGLHMLIKAVPQVLYKI